MITYHGTTEQNAQDILKNGWDANTIMYCSFHKGYAIGYARRTWLSDTSDKPVLLYIETDSDNMIMTNLTLTNGEVIIKDTHKVKIINMEYIE